MYILNLTKLQFIIINIFVIFIFAFIYNIYGSSDNFIFMNGQKNMDMTESLYFSAITYSTIGSNTIYPKTKFIKFIIMIQIIILLISIVMLSPYGNLSN
jgi:hypothetical protein